MSGVPWAGGPPTIGELENWLVATRGVPRAQARRIAQSYVTTGVYQSGISGPLTRDGLDQWVDAQLANVNVEERVPDFSAVGDQARQIVQEREAEDSARATRNDALTEQRSQVVAGQVQSYYDQAQSLRDSLAMSRAVGVFTDPSGEPIVGPDGEIVPVDTQTLWDEIRGLSFNMGGLAMPYTASSRARSERSMDRGASPPPTHPYGTSRRALDADAARAGRNRNSRFKPDPGPARRRILTPSAAMALLGSMDEDYLTRLQQEMFEAGLFEGVELGGEGAAPSWGQADAMTRQAFMDLFAHAAMRDPNAPISRILNELAAERTGRLPPPESGPGAPGSQEVVPIPDFQPQVMSDASLSGLVDDMAKDMLGEFLPPERRKSLMDQLRQRETEIQRQEYDTSVSNIREQAAAQFAVGGTGGAAGAGGAEIDRFMAAISGQESGGDYDITNPDSGAYGRYQIMPANWGPWATRAGLGPRAPRTAENQEIVARRIMLDYDAQFGNWRDVAVAWYAGPGRVAQLRNSQRAQGRYPSISRYADQIMSRMGQLASSDPMAQSGLVETGGRDLPPIQQFDAAAEAEAIIKAQDPQGWEAHEFADRAIEYYSLLGGVV